MEENTDFHGLKIAAYVNEQNLPVDFFEAGSLRVFQQTADCWEAVAEVPFRLTQDMVLAEFQRTLKGLVTELGDCRAFIVNELRGVPCAILDGLGFSLWRGQGDIETQLEMVATQIVEKAREAAASAEQPGVPVDFWFTQKTDADKAGADAGVYELDLRKILQGDISAKAGFALKAGSRLASDSALNSWQILVPFLENTEFRKLEVVCDHRPRWLNEEMARLSLLVEETPLSDGGALLVIVPVPGVVRRIGSNRHASGSRYKHCGCGG